MGEAIPAAPLERLAAAFPSKAAAYLKAAAWQRLAAGEAEAAVADLTVLNCEDPYVALLLGLAKELSNNTEHKDAQKLLVKGYKRVIINME